MADAKVPVSVVIPCYRCSDTIERAIDSVMQQTKMPTEVILVDDFSNDMLRTVRQLKALKEKYINQCSVTIVELSENVGAGNARNVGWEKSSQPFIAFLDADDAWDIHKLEIQTRWMLENQDCVFSCHQSEPMNDCFAHAQKFQMIDRVYINKFLMLFKNDVATRTVMIKSNIRQRFPIHLRHAEDYCLWMSILFCGGSAAKIKLPLAYTFKQNYGQQGLSSNLAAMHQGVECVLYTLKLQKKISYWLYFLATSSEVLKYSYRVIRSFIKMNLPFKPHHD